MDRITRGDINRVTVVVCCCCYFTLCALMAAALAQSVWNPRQRESGGEKKKILSNANQFSLEREMANTRPVGPVAKGLGLFLSLSLCWAPGARNGRPGPFSGTAEFQGDCPFHWIATSSSVAASSFSGVTVGSGNRW